MTLYNEIRKEYDTFLNLEKQREDLEAKRSKLYASGEFSSCQSLRQEIDALREPIITHLRKAADLSENVYESRICATNDRVVYSVKNFFVHKAEEFHRDFPFELSYYIEGNLKEDGDFIFRKFFQLLQGGHEEMVCNAVVEEGLDKLNEQVSRRSNADIETISNFALRCGENFSDNLFTILKANKKENLVKVFSNKDSLLKFQKEFNSLLSEMVAVLSVKDKNITLSAMEKFSDEKKDYVIARLEKLNSNTHKATTERDIAWQEITTPKRKM